MFSSCNFFKDVFADGKLENLEKIEEIERKPEITSLKLNKTKLSMKVGGMDLLDFSYTPSSANITPELSYDEKKLQVTMKGNSLVLNALEEGQSELTVSYEKYASTCIVSIAGYEPTYEKIVEPYIYSNTTILQMSPGASEKVFCSLYGGDVSDINNYTWTVDDNSVCSIQPTGQYCIITAKSTGYTRVKITHSKCTYPYYMGVYVFDDFTKTTYITTNDNIQTLKNNDGDKSITVSLVNPKDVSSQGNFTWTLINENENEKIPVSIVSNGNKCVISPKNNGICTIRVTHPEAIYPLDIVCRVITIIENVYIEPDKTIVTLSGSTEESITCELKNAKEGSYSIDDFSYSLENENVAKITASIGNQVFLKGIANGSTKLLIKHENAEYTREVLIISTNQLTDAIDTTNYITTTQNYIKTKVGNEPIAINVSLRGGSEGDENNFIWNVKHSPTSELSDVIKLETVNGNVSSSRAAIKTNVLGTAYITPLAEGTAVISVSHPDVLYPTEILVKVLGKEAILEEPLYLTGEGILKIVNGTEKNYTVGLRGNNKNPLDEQKIKWSEDDPRITVLGNDASATVKAPSVGTGNTISHINISHPKVDVPKTVLVLTADTEAELNNIKALYSDKLYYNIKVGESVNLFCEQVGFEDTESINEQGEIIYTPYDFSRFNWRIGDPSIISIDVSTYNPCQVNVTALKAGTTKLTGSIDGYSCVFTITVYPESAINIDPDVYFTTTQNVIYLPDENTNKDVYINAINLNYNKLSEIEWISENEEICSVSGTGTSGHITAKKIGETIIKVSHPDSQNVLKIYVRVGNQYVMDTIDSENYITTSQNYIKTKVGADPVPLQVKLITNTYGDENNLTWNVKQNPSNGSKDVIKLETTNGNVTASRSLNVSGNAYITPLAEGTATITVTHPDVLYPTEILVKVLGKDAVLEESLIEPDVYFTTTQNVIYLPDVYSNKNITINAINLNGSKLPEIQWECENEEICSVIGNGTSGHITAKKIGETVIKVIHPDSQNVLKIYVRVGNQYVSKDLNPIIYILSQDVMTMLRDDSAQKLQATLINNVDNSPNQFSFSSSNESVARITAQSMTGIAYISPVSSGQAEITITNTITDISKKVLILVGNSKEELASFTYLSTDTNVVTIGEGNSRNINVTIQNSTDIILNGFRWSSSDYSIVDVIPTGSTAVLKANKTGVARVTVSNDNCKYPLDIIVQVVDPITVSANPYIQLSASVMVLNIGDNYSNITADLIGGSEADFSDFIWETNDSSVCTIYGQNQVGKVKAVGQGQTYVTVKHPKAFYSAQILIVAEEKKKSDCYISVPSSIVTMKPTDGTQTITASLINGTSTDKYNFTWSLDVYDVIDFQYSANVCTITPKQTGTTTITISHPKAEYDQQVIVTVTEYTTFAFPESSYSITQGDVKFLNMQVPTTSVKTHIEYKVANENICSVTGTKAVVQITGIANGTTTVKARLIATATGIEQASSEMMIYVKEKATNAAYITSPSTIYTVAKGKSQTLSASISGSDVTTQDQYKLKWTTSDSDIIQVTGISSDGSVMGQSIYITALKPGEAIITCSHEKASSDLQFYVVVPGTGTKTITLDKSYMTLVKGGGATALTATIENMDSNDDYNNIIWTVIGPNGVDGSNVARKMGEGKKIQIYPVSPGEVTVYAQLPDAPTPAKCTVVVEAGKSFIFENSSLRVSPYQTKELHYTVSPPNAVITWTRNSTDDYWDYETPVPDENGNGKVIITGIMEGQGMLIASTDGGATARVTIKTSWSYDMEVKGNTNFSITPDEEVNLTYKVYPANAEMSAEGPELGEYYTVDFQKISSEFDSNSNEYALGTIIIKPIKEYHSSLNIIIRGTNPVNGNTVGEAKVTGKIRYPNYAPTISVLNRIGKFSRVVDNSIFIGDGEELLLDFGIAEENPYGSVIDVSMEWNNHVSSFGIQRMSSESKIKKSYRIYDTNDYIWTNQVYKINSLYVPIYNGMKIDWKNNLTWRTYSYHMISWDDYYGLTLKNGWVKTSPMSETEGVTTSGPYGENPTTTYPTDGWLYAYTDSNDGVHTSGNLRIEEDETYRGREMSESEFKNYAWLYCPGLPAGQPSSSGYTQEITYNSSFTQGNYGKNHQIEVENVGYAHPTGNADYEVVTKYSNNTSPINAPTLIGYLTITFDHAGLNEYATKYYTVYREEYECKNR